MNNKEYVNASNYLIKKQEKIKQRKKISKMDMEELNNFLDNKCKTKQERIKFLANININPYFELYEDSKNLSNIILENGKEINLDFNDLKLDDDFVFEKKFVLITNDKRIGKKNYCCTTKQIFYYRINEYFKEIPIIEDVINNCSKNENIKKELEKLSKLEDEILNYINKQKTIYKEFKQDIENRITEVYNIGINDYQNNIYENMLQDVRKTKKVLNKTSPLSKKRIKTQGHHLFKDLKYYLQDNYNYQKQKLNHEIKILEKEIKDHDKYKDGLSQKKQDLKKLKSKLKNIPKDRAIKIENFLYKLGLKVDIKNTNKYDTNYIFLYKIVED